MKRRRVLQFGFLLVLFALWQGLFQLGLWNELLFPSPKQVLDSLVIGFGDWSIPLATLSSLRRLLTGYGISIVIGLPLGLFMGRKPRVDDTLGMLAVGLQALPSICWLPLAVLWFGLNESAMIFIVVMGSLMSIALSVRDGVKTVPPLYLRASRVLGATPGQQYLHVILPAALPAIVSGARLGWTFAWRSLMAAELLYVSSGLGSSLTMGRELHDMALVVGLMGVVLVIGLGTDRLLFRPMERWIQVRWGFSSG